MSSKQHKKFELVEDVLFKDVTIPVVVMVLIATTSLTAGIFVGWSVYDLIMGKACYQDVMVNVIPVGFSNRTMRVYEFVGHPDLRLSPGLVVMENGTYGIESRLMLDHVFIVHGNCEMGTGGSWMLKDEP